jgi:hypothetical protein
LSDPEAHHNFKEVEMVKTSGSNGRTIATLPVRARGGRFLDARAKREGRTPCDGPHFVKTGFFRRILDWFEHGCEPPILIVLSPPGLGKTYTLRYIATLLRDIPFFFIPATWGQNLEYLLGIWELRGGEGTVFTEGDLYKALTTPNACIIIDDAHCVAQELQLLNGLGDSSREVVCASLGSKVEVAPGVKLVLLANPPPTGIAPWEAQRWEIPMQIRDRAVMLELSEGLTPEDERAILEAYWPKRHPEEVLEGLLELSRNLRTNQVLQSFTPSIRSLIITAMLLDQGETLADAFRYGIACKYTDGAERAAAMEAFSAKFDPSEDGTVPQTE